MFGLFQPPARRYPFRASCPCGASIDTEFLTANDHYLFAASWIVDHGDHGREHIHDRVPVHQCPGCNPNG